MSRDLPLGNGHVLVGFDREGRLTDLFYPWVGMENQTDGHVCRFGIWRAGEFAWFPEDFAHVERGYETDTLVTRFVADAPRLGLHVEWSDTVDFQRNVLLRAFTATNLPDAPAPDAEIRLFWHLDLYLRGNDVGDCAFYEPERSVVVHYKGNRYVLAGGAAADRPGLTGYAIGVAGIHGLEGTWRDAEDGVLDGNPVAQGAVDSVVSLTVHPGETAYHWLAVGVSLAEVLDLDERIRSAPPENVLNRTRTYWRHWVGTSNPHQADLSPELWALYRRSLLIARTHIDESGSVLASGDWETTRLGHDTYAYMWARDGAFVVDAVGKAGLLRPALAFFQFCADAIAPEGYMFHKHNPDGTPGATWHPWIAGGHPILPIQEDETALVLWALWRHFRRSRSLEDIRPFYRSLVTRAADFLAAYRDPATGLPRPSFDLWEERRGIPLFTVATVYAGLVAGGRFADMFGEPARSRVYREAARGVRDAASRCLYDPEMGRFARMGTVDPASDTLADLDLTLDASLFAVPFFGIFEPDDPRLQRTLEQAREQLWVPGPVGGVARYEKDYYHWPLAEEPRPGNPWFICTLWAAQWAIRQARKREDLGDARHLLEWAARHALPSGVLSEQIHPETHAPLSVSPLTWSHATFVSAMLSYVDRYTVLH